MARVSEISPRVLAVAEVVRRLSQDELAQLVELVPVLQEVEPAAIPEIEALAFFRARGREERGGKLPSLDEEFIGGLSFAQYLALSEQEEEAFWERLFAQGKMDLEDFEEHNVRPDARLSAGQESRS